MKIVKVIDIITKDDQESFDIEDLAGTPAPHAYHINYHNHGYAKFKLSHSSLAVFEEKLHLIEESMCRKQLYNIMEDMLRTNDLPGARFYNIIKSQIVKETAVDVISSVFRSVLPLVVRDQMPLDMYE